MPIELRSGFTSFSRNGCCSICGLDPGKTNPRDPQSVNRNVITTGTDIDMEGPFDICMNCATEIGSLADMLPADQAETLQAERDEYAEQLLSVQDELVVVRGAVSALVAESHLHEGREANALSEGYAQGVADTAASSE